MAAQTSGTTRGFRGGDGRAGVTSVGLDRCQEVLRAYRDKFAGKYEHRTITGDIGHNLPQEAPQASAQAVINVASY